MCRVAAIALAVSIMAVSGESHANESECATLLSSSDRSSYGLSVAVDKISDTCRDDVEHKTAPPALLKELTPRPFPADDADDDLKKADAYWRGIVCALHPTWAEKDMVATLAREPARSVASEIYDATRAICLVGLSELGSSAAVDRYLRESRFAEGLRTYGSDADRSANIVRSALTSTKDSRFYASTPFKRAALREVQRAIEANEPIDIESYGEYVALCTSPHTDDVGTCLKAHSLKVARDARAVKEYKASKLRSDLLKWGGLLSLLLSFGFSLFALRRWVSVRAMVALVGAAGGGIVGLTIAAATLHVRDAPEIFGAIVVAGLATLAGAIVGGVIGFSVGPKPRR